MNEVQKIILTCLLGPEDPDGFKKFCSRARVAKYRAKYLERSRASCRKYAQEHREDAVKRAKKSRANNRERSNENSRRSAKKARTGEKREATLAMRRRIYARRCQEPEYKIPRCLRGRLLSALKVGGVRKAENTLALLGCSTPQLLNHLESQFKPGMTWENHGPVWHIDHIKPCAKFDLTDPEQQKACFHWTNLQPLFAEENLRKGGK